MIGGIAALLLAGAQIVAGQFAIAGERFAPEEILDARAVPELAGGTNLMISFAPAAAKRLATLTGARVGQTMELTLDGKVLDKPRIAEPIVSGVVTITGAYSLAEGEALARRISGKEPLPDEFEE